MLHTRGLSGLFAVVLGLLSHNAARAIKSSSQRYQWHDRRIHHRGGYVKPALISWLRAPYSIAVGPTIPEPGIGTLALFGLVLAGLATMALSTSLSAAGYLCSGASR